MIRNGPILNDNIRQHSARHNARRYFKVILFVQYNSLHPMYSLCSLQTYIMYLIKYLAITIYFSVMSNKLLPYHMDCFLQLCDSLSLSLSCEWNVLY